MSVAHSHHESTSVGLTSPMAPRPRMVRRILRALEHPFTILVMLVLASAVTPLIRPERDLIDINTEGDRLSQALLGPIYLATGTLVLLRYGAALRAIMRHLWVLALPAFALLSYNWSVVPELSLRRGIALIGTTVIGVYLASRFDVSTLVRFVAWTLGVCAVMSAAVALAVPHLGVMGGGAHLGAWRGVFQNKNVLGRAMTLGVAACLVLRRDRLGPRGLATAGAVLCTALVGLSGSKAALVITILLILLIPLYGRLSSSPGMVTIGAIMALLFIGVIGSWTVSNLDAVLAALGPDSALAKRRGIDAVTDLVLGALGRNATLSGRTQLWALVINRIGDRPWLGYGFSAFWTRTNAAAISIIDEIKWQAPHAHNGFLDLALEIGLVGIALFLLSYASAVARAIRSVRTADTPRALWPLVFLTFLFLFNLTERTILRQGSLFWTLYVATACAPDPRSSRRGEPPGAEALPGVRRTAQGVNPRVRYRRVVRGRARAGGVV